MDIQGNGILSLARQEYTDKLCFSLTPPIYKGLKSIWETIKETHDTQALLNFQKQLMLIPKWNSEIIDTECKRINGTVDLVKLEKLVEAVFIFNVKTL